MSGRKARNLEYRRRLDQVLAEFDRPPLTILDKNKEPFTANFKVTDVSWEPRIVRDIVINHKNKKAYFVHYDEAMRLSKEQIKELYALQLSKTQNDGFLEYQTDLYNGKGYRVIEQGDIIQVDGQFYFNEYQTKNFEKKEPYMPDIAPNLYKIGDDIYEKEGELYYTYPNRDAIYVEQKVTNWGSRGNLPEGKKIIEGYQVVPLKNEAVKERYPFKEWRSDVDYNFAYSEPNAINPIDSQRAFRFQMVEPSLAQQKTMQVTLTSYHPITHEPLDEVKITLHRDKNAKVPGTFVSDPLALTSYRDNALNGAPSDQVLAYAGSQLAVSYLAINEETVKIPIGSVKVEKVLEVDAVIFKDGQEEANLKLAESQLAEQVAADLAPLGIQVKINTHLVDKPIELDGASPEKMAAIAKQHASNPQAITMVMGARNHGTFYSSADPNAPKALQNTLFIDHVQISDQISRKMNYYGADEIIPQMLLISSGYLEADKKYSWTDYQPTQDRAKYYHASPLLSEPPKPQVVVDPFTSKPALAP